MNSVKGHGSFVRVVLAFAVWLASTLDGSAAEGSPIDTAVQQNDWNLITKLRNDAKAQHRSFDAAVMVAAADAGNVSVLEKMVAEGVPVDLAGKADPLTGENALMHAAYRGQVATVRWLLEHGANAKFVGRCFDSDCRGHTALNGVAQSGSVEIARLLLKAGADPRAAGNWCTHAANFNVHIGVYELLVANGGSDEEPHPYKRGKSLSESPIRSAPDFPALGIAELLPNLRPATSSARSSVCRLAILSDSGTESLANLLTAQLSVLPEFALVERQEVDRILAEQRFTRAAAVDSSDIGRVSRWLPADALVFLQTRNILGKQVVESRTVRVAAGVIDDTACWPAPIRDATAWVQTMQERVLHLANRSSREGVLAVSTVGVRSTIGSPLGVALERSLSALLTQRLTRQPGIVLLERAALDRVAEEAPGAPQSFWKGKYLAEATVSPDLARRDTFHLRIELKPIGEGKVAMGVADGTTDQPVAALDKALGAALQTFGPVSDQATVADLDEARYLAEQSTTAAMLQLYRRAGEAAEAAWALGIHDPAIAKLRVEAPLRFLETERQIVTPGYPYRQYMPEFRDFFHHPKRGPECPEGAEWLQTIRRSLEQWRTQLADCRKSDRGATKEWLAFGVTVFAQARTAMVVFDTAAEIVRQKEALAALRETWRAAFRDAEEVADELADLELIRGVAAEHMVAVAEIADGAASMETIVAELLSRHCRTDDTYFRAMLRTKMTLDKSREEEAEVAARISNVLRSSNAPEDRLFALKMARTKGMSQAERASLQRLAMKACRELAPSWVARPPLQKVITETFSFYETEGKELNPQLPLLKTKVSSSPQRFAYTDEYQRFRVDLLLEAFRVADSLEHMTFWWTPEVYKPDDVLELKNAAKAWLARTEGGSSDPAQSLTRKQWLRRIEGSDVAARGAAVAPLSASATRVPSTADASALPKIGTYWRAAEHTSRQDWDVEVSYHGCAWAEKSLWFMGRRQINARAVSTIYPMLFKVSLPSLETEVFPLPAYDREIRNGESFSEGGQVYPGAAMVQVLIPGEGLASYDRQSQQWEINRDFKPAGEERSVMWEEKIYFIQRDAGSDALFCWDTSNQKIDLVASTRRSPGETPIDDPTVFYHDLRLANGVLGLNTPKRAPGQTRPGSYSVISAYRTEGSPSQTSERLQDLAGKEAYYHLAERRWDTQKPSSQPAGRVDPYIVAHPPVTMVPITAGPEGTFKVRVNGPPSVPNEVLLMPAKAEPGSMAAMPPVGTGQAVGMPVGVVVAGSFSAGFWFVRWSELQQFPSTTKPKPPTAPTQQ